MRVLELDDPPRACLADLFAVQSQRLVRTLTTYTGDHSAAEELAQEAFARLHSSQPQLREPERLVSYLYSIAFNLARSRWRRQQCLDRALQRLGVPTESSPDVAATSLRNATAAATAAAVMSLPERQRACVVLRYYTDLGVADTAMALDISPNSVKTHLKRALAGMRCSLADEIRENLGARSTDGKTARH
jgi:RNA polymerase sigma factor (sigma-70 family)